MRVARGSRLSASCDATTCNAAPRSDWFAGRPFHVHMHAQTMPLSVLSSVRLHTQPCVCLTSAGLQGNDPCCCCCSLNPGRWIAASMVTHAPKSVTALPTPCTEKATMLPQPSISLKSACLCWTCPAAAAALHASAAAVSVGPTAGAALPSALPCRQLLAWPRLTSALPGLLLPAGACLQHAGHAQADQRVTKCALTQIACLTAGDNLRQHAAALLSASWQQCSALLTRAMTSRGAGLCSVQEDQSGPCSGLSLRCLRLSRAHQARFPWLLADARAAMSCLLNSQQANFAVVAGLASAVRVHGQPGHTLLELLLQVLAALQQHVRH